MLRLIQDMRGRTCLHRAAASGQADALFAVKDTFQGFSRVARWWFQRFFYFHPYLGKISNLTNILQRG